MSRQELKDFIKAVERNYSLKKEVRKCKNNLLIINMARKYGYKINKNDLEEKSVEQMIDNWFQKSNLDKV